jgi:phytanoyl-CoA hydroxylase
LKKHKLNNEFSWEDKTGPFRFISDSDAEAWNRDGYFVLRNVFDAAAIRRLTEEIDPQEQEMEAYLRTLEGGQLFISKADSLTFTTHIVLKSQWVKDFLSGPPFTGLCLDLLGAEARLYWDQAVYKKPGNPHEFPWHQDNGYTFVKPQDYLTCWIPLVDATEENGCPWVVPGIHRTGTLEHRTTELGFECLNQPEAARCVPAEAGSVVIFSSLTPHRTGPNLTGSVRKAYIAQYAHAESRMYTPRQPQGIPQNDPARQFLVVRQGEPCPQ